MKRSINWFWLTIAIVLTFIRAFAMVGVGLASLAAAYQNIMNNVSMPFVIAALVSFAIYALATYAFNKLPID